jgi:hypothetical protein
MGKLKITYSHDKEIYIVDKYQDAFKEYGEKIPEVKRPADKSRAEKIVKKLRRAWEPKETDFIEKLNRFYDCDFKIKGWSAYLIRSRICPYSPEKKFFAVSFNKSREEQLNTIGHELFHQLFHLYWEDQCLEIFKDNQIVHCLKEALAEMLNTPKFNLSKEKDIGWNKPGEQFIRHLIRNYYQKNGFFTFEDFLNLIG